MKKIRPSRYKVNQRVIVIHGNNGFPTGTVLYVADGYKCKKTNKPAIWVKRNIDDIREKWEKIKLKYIRPFDS